MKRLHASFSIPAVFIAGTLMIASILPAGAQTASQDLSGFLGRWQINLSKTKLNRFGPSGKYSSRESTYTNIYTVDGKNLREDLYEQYPASAAGRSMVIITDGKPHECRFDTGCHGENSPYKHTDVEAFTYDKIDSQTWIRVTHVNGKLTEYTSYSLASSGKTYTEIIWNPETPEWQNIYVYDKQQ